MHHYRKQSFILNVIVTMNTEYTLNISLSEAYTVKNHTILHFHICVNAKQSFILHEYIINYLSS